MNRNKLAEAIEDILEDLGIDNECAYDQNEYDEEDEDADW